MMLEREYETQFSFSGISFLLDEIQMRSCFLIFFFASGDILKNKLTFGYGIARIRAISADGMEYDMSARTEGRRAGVPAGSTGRYPETSPLAARHRSAVLYLTVLSSIQIQ